MGERLTICWTVMNVPFHKVGRFPVDIWTVSARDPQGSHIPTPLKFVRICSQLACYKIGKGEDVIVFSQFPTKEK